VRPEMRNRINGFGGLGVGLGPGLGVRNGNGIHGAGVHKRSASPFVGEGANGVWNIENPRVLFVRPSEVVYVLGAED
jgi:hypothetical protein